MGDELTRVSDTPRSLRACLRSPKNAKKITPVMQAIVFQGNPKQRGQIVVVLDFLV